VADWTGFWSYVRADDEADGGRVCRLARDVVSQFEMVTGEKTRLFLDRDAIEWGENWREKVDEGLASIAFFIPVLTPRYFMSPECRREFNVFARKASDLGIKELVLPLLYVDVVSLHEESPSDDLMKLVKTFQWEDWRELRFADVTSEEYRRGVARLAKRLFDANSMAEEADIAARMQELEAAPEEDVDRAPGLLDQLATGEEALPKWTNTIQSIAQDIESIGVIMQKAKVDIEGADSRGQGFAARLSIARKLSQELRDPVESIWSSSQDYVSQLHEIDALVRAIIDLAPGELVNNPESKSDLCGFFTSLRELSASAHEGMESTRGMIEGISPLEAMSRDLRPPLRQLRQGLTIMVEAREITDEWVELIDSTGVECDDDGRLKL
jgi:hypothetical protein